MKEQRGVGANRHRTGARAQHDDTVGELRRQPVKVGGGLSIEFRQAALKGRDDVIGGPFDALLHLASLHQAIALEDLPAEPTERASEHDHQAQEHHERATRRPEPLREQHQRPFGDQEW